MSVEYTYTRESYKGIEVFCIESATTCNLSWEDIKEIIAKLNETMFLPKRIIYRGCRQIWQGFNTETLNYLYVANTNNKGDAKRSIVLNSI